MEEHFLHYIWKHQKFTSKNLRLTNGQPLTVFHQGFHNRDSGPDFEEGRVKIEGIEWVGSIEVHVYSSDWIRHFHHRDKAYENVILHVVWSHDKDIEVNDSILPTLELKNIIDPLLLSKYQKHLASDEKIVCSSQLNGIPEITYSSMLDRVLVERLQLKAADILKALNQNKNDWENTSYQTLARNFGFSTNKSSFEKLAQKLPFVVLKRNLKDQHKTEALIFGQAGFLNQPIEKYQESLQKEFGFLSNKFKLSDPINKHEWKFGRMRPANFPTVRLAQFAALLHQNPNLFSTIISINRPKDLIDAFKIKHGVYWQAHYDFGKSRKKNSKGPGDSSLYNLIINSVSPMLAAYSRYTGEQLYMDRAILLLEAIKPEANRYTKEWNNSNKNARSAFESQAQIQLIKHYCEKRKCLDCNIGVHLLGK